jgi:hypothetical protein
MARRFGIGLAALAACASPANAAGFGSGPAAVNPDAVLTAVRDSIFVTESFEMNTPSGSSGTYWIGGFYDFVTGATVASTPVTLGTVNGSAAAHVVLVNGVLPASADTVTIIGAHITDLGVLTDPDTVSVVIAPTDSVNQKYETDAKWLGQVTISSPDIGTPGDVSDAKFNCGFAKYFDAGNSIFVVRSVEAIWLAGANDPDFAIFLRHHNGAGWGYSALGTPTYPTNIARMHVTHGVYDDLVSGDYGAWKETNLDFTINGLVNEGIIMQVNTTQNNAIEFLNAAVRYTH